MDVASRFWLAVLALCLVVAALFTFWCALRPRRHWTSTLFWSVGTAVIAICAAILGHMAFD